MSNIPNASNTAHGDAEHPSSVRTRARTPATHRGNPSASRAGACRRPPCVSGHCLRAALIVCRRPGRPPSLPQADRHRDARDAHAGDVRAVTPPQRGLAGGQAGACSRALRRDLGRRWPHDILAFAVAHALDFRLGRRKMLLDRIAQVLPAWNAGHARLRKHPFHVRLRPRGKRPLRSRRSWRAARSPSTPAIGAIHVVAHVMEMQGRAREGLGIPCRYRTGMERSAPDFRSTWPGIAHCSSSMRTIRAPRLRSTTRKSPAPGAPTCPCSPTLRHCCGGCNCATSMSAGAGRYWPIAGKALVRWRAAVLCRPRRHGVRRSRTHRQRGAGASGIAARRANGAAPRYREDTLAPPLCKALIAFARNDYAVCVEWLMRVRHITDRCGGSLAQCDLIHLTFTEAALRASKTRLATRL